MEQVAELVGRRAHLREARAATRPSPMNSMSTSVSLTCTGYGTGAPSSVSRLSAANSAYAHSTRATSRP